MKTKNIPDSITAVRAVTYNTQQIVEDISEAYEKPTYEVTLEEVMEWVRENSEEDLTTIEGAIYRDEEGREIYE
jgi:hypothetical protein